MPHFIFKARKSGGEMHKGEQDAQDRFELYKILKASGEEIVSVEEQKKLTLFKNITIPFLSGVKIQDKINFSRSLGSMIKAGLSMSQALTVMEKQGTNEIVKKIIRTVNADVQKGKTLSQAMSDFPKMFPPLMIAMVASGEQSGGLGDALKTVTLQMEKTHALQKRIRGALMYPGIIFIAMIIIGIILLTYVVPTLSKTFTDLHVALPASTRFILFVSNFFQHDLLAFLICLVVVCVILQAWSRQPGGKKIIHWVLLKIPLIGNLVQEVNVARTARTLSSLISGGVDMLEALRITRDIVQNVHYKKVLEDAFRAVEKGEPLSRTFDQNPKLYPVFLSEMISVGEETGKIGEMMIGVAVYYEDDVDLRTKDMSTVIEPFLMIVIGAAVGFFAVAMISPMYALVNTI